MTNLITQCNDLLRRNGFEYAFCGGHALDLFLGGITRPHGDIDISAWREDRDAVIVFIQSQGWTVYEAMGGGVVHLVTDIRKQKRVKRNIFCVKEDCPFFHVELTENNIYRCDIDRVEQKNLDFIEFLFNKKDANDFVYTYNETIRRALALAILHRGDVPYLAPELALLYKSTDLTREENQRDFNTALPFLNRERLVWLQGALPEGHPWIARLKEVTV